MFPGNARRRIEIQASTETPNSYGEPILAWTKFLESWASVVPLRGREFFDGKQTKSDIDVKITMQYQAGVLPGMRAIEGARVFDIESVIDVEDRNQKLELMCKQGV